MAKSANWSAKHSKLYVLTMLLQFQEQFQPMIKKLQEYYEVRKADDTDFICKYKLKNEVGIDVEELEAMFSFSVVEKDEE